MLNLLLSFLSTNANIFVFNTIFLASGMLLSRNRFVDLLLVILVICYVIVYIECDELKKKLWATMICYKGGKY